MRKLYAINQANGENEPVANLSDEDASRIGRGYDVGHSFGVVTDQDSGQQFEVFQANCDLDDCNCAVTVEPA